MKEKILEKIRNDNVSMYSRGYFLLRLVGLAVVSLSVLLITIFIFNFIFFGLRLNGHESLLSAGPRGLLLFLHVFPWFWLALDCVLILGLEWMLRHFRFGYRIPVLYLLAGLLLVALPLGLVLDRATSFNDRVLSRADHHRLHGAIGNFYQGARHAPPPGRGNCRCTIVSIGTSTLGADDIDPDKTTHLTLVLPPGYSSSSFAVGDVVFVAGDRIGDIIEAFDISRLPAGVPPQHDDRR